ncbi:hypothetical protein GGR51DRAFT_563879 [Nemania sp. FL0031]|nr:hypothetical protein GGR51DRAFT_563879 [Nemania sp. FL0031]
MAELTTAAEWFATQLKICLAGVDKFGFLPSNRVTHDQIYSLALCIDAEWAHRDHVEQMIAHPLSSETRREALVRLQGLWWLLNWTAVAYQDSQETIIEILLAIQGLPAREWTEQDPVVWEREKIGYQELTGWLYNWSYVYDECRRMYQNDQHRWRDANRYMGLLLASDCRFLYSSTRAFAVAESVIFLALERPSPVPPFPNVLAAAELFKTASPVFYILCRDRAQDSGIVGTLGLPMPSTDAEAESSINVPLFIRLGGRYTLELWDYWKTRWHIIMLDDEVYDDEIRQAAEEASLAMTQAAHVITRLPTALL